ncbi:MAG: cytochrome P450 [Deltaproteobacteria bacterium]|nr:cytochrome P450 [Deltaproteobacteria bacterium]
MRANAMDRDLSPDLLLEPSIIDDPYDFYRRLVSEAPVWHVPGTDIVIVSSWEAVTQVVNRVEDFSSNIHSILCRSALGTPELVPMGFGGLQALATADPPMHGAHRSTVFPELVARRMAGLRTSIEALTEECLTHALSKRRFEVMGDLANLIPIRVVSQLIAFRGADPAALLAAAFDSTAMLAATLPLEGIQALMARTVDIATWIADQLQQSVIQGGEGIFGVIGAAVAAGEMEFDAGLVILHTLLSAGGESTTSLLGNAIHMLALDPRLQTRLRTEPHLVVPFIEEALRLESPFRYHLRRASRASEVQGVGIPAGSTLLLFWGAANRDPAEFERADDVMLDRATPKHHVAFGRGIHFCVGAPLARLEAEIVLTRLLAQTEHFELDPDAVPERVDSLMVRRFDTLPLVAELSS